MPSRVAIASVVLVQELLNVLNSWSGYSRLYDRARLRRRHRTRANDPPQAHQQYSTLAKKNVNNGFNLSLTPIGADR